jgi:hypothetical protein
MKKTISITKQSIVEQLKYTDNAIQIAPDEQSRIMFKSLKILLLLGLVELVGCQTDDYLNDHMELLNFIALVRNPNRRIILDDFLKIHETLTMSLEVTFGLPEWENNLLKSITFTLRSLSEHYKLQKI